MALLELKHISKSFGQNQVLRDVNFELRPGEVHALLGENGAGKSTMLNIIGGVFEPSGGTILIDGEEKKSHLFSMPKILELDLCIRKLNCVRM